MGPKSPVFCAYWAVSRLFSSEAQNVDSHTLIELGVNVCALHLDPCLCGGVLIFEKNQYLVTIEYKKEGGTILVGKSGWCALTVSKKILTRSDILQEDKETWNRTVDEEAKPHLYPSRHVSHYIR